MRPALRIAFAEVARLVAAEAPLACQVRKRNGSGSVAAPLTAELLGMDAPAAVLLERLSPEHRYEIATAIKDLSTPSERDLGGSSSAQP